MTRRLPLIGALIAVVVIAVWFVAAWRPAGSRLNSVRAATATATLKRSQLAAELAHVQALERALPGESAALQRSLPALPLSISADTVVDQINGIALSDHITWSDEGQAVDASVPTTSSPTTVVSQGSSSSSTPTSTTPTTTAATTAQSAAAVGASTVSLTLTVAGTYPDMQTFITALERRPRLIVIDSLAYSPSNKIVTVQIAGRAFYDSTPVPSIPKFSSGS